MVTTTALDIDPRATMAPTRQSPGKEEGGGGGGRAQPSSRHLYTHVGGGIITEGPATAFDIGQWTILSSLSAEVAVGVSGRCLLAVLDGSEDLAESFVLGPSLVSWSCGWSQEDGGRMRMQQRARVEGVDQ